MHWGNILIKKTNDEYIDLPIIKDSEYRIQRIPSFGVKCFIIDLTMCRLLIGNRIYFTNLDDEPSIFEADDSEDFQFAVYKKMKQHTDDWSDFQPKNNLLWCQYLLDKLCKKKKVSDKSSKDIKREMKELQGRIMEYISVHEMLLEDEFFVSESEEPEE